MTSPRRTSTFHTICLRVAAAAAVFACGGQQESTDAGIDSRELVEPQVSSNWIGHDVGVSPGRWYRRASMHALGDAPEPGAVPGAGAVAPGDATMVIGKADTDEVYEVEMDSADLGVLADYMTDLGYADGRPSDNPEWSETPPDEMVKKGWGGGTDERTPRGIYEYGINVGAYNRIGGLRSPSAACTGTLIGNVGAAGRYVLTAAHCLFPPPSYTYSNPSFVPRHDNCTRPDGTWIPGCSQTPFGASRINNWMMPAYFYDNCRSSAVQFPDCHSQDIAVLAVSVSVGGESLGSYYFEAISDSTLQGLTKMNFGYPGCNKAGDPATNCRDRTLYGMSNCPIGASSYPDGDGWGRRILHGCDTSPGHSGSPMIADRYGLWKVWGVHSAGKDGCFAGCSDPTPDAARRITPGFYRQMLAFMGVG